MDALEALFREALSTGAAATAAQSRYLDALRARNREERAAARECLRVSREIAHAAMVAYTSARAERNAADLAAYLAR